MRKYVILAALVVLLAVAVPFMEPRPTAAAFVGAGCAGGPPGAGSWNLLAGGCACQNEDFIINGSVVVSGGGVSLTMDNCTIRFNCASPLGCGMLVSMGGALTMDNQSMTVNATPNAYTFRLLGSGGANAFIRNSTVSGVGAASGALALTGLYVEGSGAAGMVLHMENSTVVNGYRGVVASDAGTAPWNTLRLTLLNNTIANNTGYGVYNYMLNGTVIDSNIIDGNGNDSVRIENSYGVRAINNTITNNKGAGVWVQASNMTSRNITYNYIFNNSGDGIHVQNSLDSIDIKFNTILNNTGWGIWSFEGGSAGQNVIRNNTMCYNGNTTYWTNTGGSDYGGAPPMGNTFCVNISMPVKGGCTNSDEVRFNVSGNPLSWCAGCGAFSGMTNCTLSIDDAQKNWTLTPGAYHESVLAFNGTAVGDGPHNVSVHCDPYDNIAQVMTDYIRDTVPPLFDNQSSSGGGQPCGVSNINLAVHWEDSTCNVSYVTLSTNETGAHENKSAYGSPLQAGWKSNWTNFSWWNESVKNRWINWFVWANDSAGNWNYSTNATFLADPCTTESVVTGGSPGGGGLGGAEPYSCSKASLVYTFNGVPAGTYTNANYTKYCHDIRLDSFYKSVAGSAKFTFRPLDSAAPLKEGLAYRYYNASLDTPNATVSEVKIGFAVNNSWLLATGIGYSDIMMLGFNGTGWTELARRNVGRDDNATYYQADIVLPAVLAVVGVPECKCPAPSNWSACIQGNQTRSDYDCNATTGYTCVPVERKRPCLECPACPAPIHGKCVNGLKKSMYFYCNETTDYACMNYTVEESCAVLPGLPQIDFGKLISPQSPAEWVQTGSVAGVAAVVAAVAAYHFLRVRKRFQKRAKLDEKRDEGINMLKGKKKVK
ncbi:MAG: right-handed parallel beta-helix repeat-containing protein [Candidatus Aenigmatarchaeota archaeon]